MVEIQRILERQTLKEMISREGSEKRKTPEETGENYKRIVQEKTKQFSKS
jgi:hypothetical protein